MMESVIECVNKGVNGLIESPTGTGKTLSIICAAVAAVQKSRRDYAIRQANKANNKKTTVTKVASTSGDSTTGEDEEVKAKEEEEEEEVATTIIFCTRTHSQIE